MNRRELIKILGVTPLLAAARNSIGAAGAARQDADLLVYGATPGGVACAVRAAREGLQVLLVSPVKHLGGMFANGLGIMDTLYNGSRAPVYDEFRKSIYDFYRRKYGTASAQYENAGPGISKTKYEAHVAEQLINELLVAEPNIRILKDYYPVKVSTKSNAIESVRFASRTNGIERTLTASIVADCSYEGDLMVIAGVNFQYGREAKQEYGEKYAGVIYTKDVAPSEMPNEIPEDQTEIIRRLNLFRYSETRTRIFFPESTGNADPAIQAFNLRAILTNDPANRVMPVKPEGYDPAHFQKNYQHKKENLTLSRPNNKTSLNYPKILGLQNKYVSGDWNTRMQVTDQFYRELTGLLYFRQHDPSLPEELRLHWQQYGFAKDEFVDNNHLPYELYVRESRRLRGRAVFTEKNATLQTGLQRAPVQEHSIGSTEWFLDSHACTDQQLPGSKQEGEVMLKSETVPGQIPLQTIFPRELNNLLVPVCLSASHIGWGAVRLEPVWMQIGEAAGLLASLAIKKALAPVAVDADTFVQTLAQRRFLVSFFNDVEARELADWYPAVQYLGTKGFFASYEARPDEKLTIEQATSWMKRLTQWNRTNRWPAQESVDITAGQPIALSAFSKMLSSITPTATNELIRSWKLPDSSHLTRGQASQLIMETIITTKRKI